MVEPCQEAPRQIETLGEGPRSSPLVEELLRLEGGSAAIADQIIRRCGSPGCSCPETLTEGR